ncbi:hypothetical protein [Actinoallomurus sp. NPDC052274]|uniref:hypothetical protein n=1 Tax=Actinoallomurus sp. NPDC052274 TaxID=3155420 RepID=UPI0034481FD0
MSHDPGPGLGAADERRQRTPAPCANGPYDAWPLRLDVAACNRWTYFAVTDPDHRPLPASDEGGQLVEHGRGLGIVDHIAATRWVTYAEHGKTVHVVVAAPGVTLTPDELQQIRKTRPGQSRSGGTGPVLNAEDRGGVSDENPRH